MAVAKQSLDLRELWPQDLEVKCELGRYVKPGRVDWKAKPLGDCSKLVPVNLGFTWEWLHPCKIINMRRRP